jgi:cyanophycin synthetase
LAVLKRVIVQNVAPKGTAVLNAADPVVAAMAAKCRGSVTFFALDQYHPVMATHRAQGHAVVFVENGQIVAAKGSEKHYLNLAEIPVTLGGAIGFQVENVMASVAALWALGVDWNTVRAGLASFSSEQNNAQGRFNVFDYKGATVIADYGHNPDAMAALVQAVQAIPASRRAVVISGPGDRRDEDIRQITQILGEAFDEVVMYEDQCQRGRADGEVMALLRDGLAQASKTTKRSEVYGEFLAIDTALDSLRAGELCLVLVDQVPQAMAHIQARIQAL